MSYTADMTPSDSGDRAVGWLHPDQPFPKGPVSTEFLARLKEFASGCNASARALGWGAMCGVHTCEFCDKFCATGSFGVPFADSLLIAPAMIAHYVEAHQYAPPSEFAIAITGCPIPGTREYVTAVAPFVERQRAKSMVDGVSITLERDAALVVYNLLSQFSDTEGFWVEERPEQVALWTLLGCLESVLVEPFDPAYQDLLKQARLRITHHERQNAAQTAACDLGP
jgi:hypothetical protein